MRTDIPLAFAAAATAVVALSGRILFQGRCLACITCSGCLVSQCHPRFVAGRLRSSVSVVGMVA